MRIRLAGQLIHSDSAGAAEDILISLSPLNSSWLCLEGFTLFNEEAMALQQLPTSCSLDLLLSILDCSISPADTPEHDI